jgi:glycosyltransferase involved in cell wall biosynthesis
MSAYPINQSMPEMSLRHTGSILTQPVALVIPVKNQARTISSRVQKAFETARAVVIVDDGSTDGTPELACRAGAFVVRREAGEAWSRALQAGIRLAAGHAPVVCVGQED